MNSILKIAHISDPHMSSLDHIGWGELLNKRILGYLSWRLDRCNSHSREVLSHILDDLTRQQPAHLLISGDLTNLGTAHECAEAKTWLNSIGTPDYISVVPGNHDHYAAVDFARTTGQWLDYMRSDPDRTDDARGFPYLRIRGPVAIIGLSTAVPTGPFYATGQVGRKQLERFDDVIRETGERGLYRIVMLHHGPQSKEFSYRRRLIDTEDLLSVVDKHGIEMMVHGHGHRQIHNVLRSGPRRIPLLGVPSASACYADPEKKAGYNIYEVNKTPGGWLAHVSSYVFNTSKKTFFMNFSKVFEASRNPV